MINPIYFPFTHMPKFVADCLRTCFQMVTAYALSDRQADKKREQWLDAAGLEIRVPVQMDETVLDTIFADYRSWADLHKGELLAYLKTQRDRIPFFQEQSLSQIVRDIKAGGTSSPSDVGPDTEYAEHLLQTGLFLHAAEMYDMHIEETTDNLHRFERMEQDFVADLREKGDLLYRNISGNRTIAWEDTGYYMTTDRIRSWARLMLHDPISPALYITSSAAVVSHLQDRSEDMRVVLESTCIPVTHPTTAREGDLADWQDRLGDCLKNLMEGSWDPQSAPMDIPGPLTLPEDGGPAFNFALYRIPGQAPRDYFGDLSGFLPREDRDSLVSQDDTCTLIGLVTPI